MKRPLTLFIICICLFACNSKKPKITYIPIDDGVELLFGNIKQAITEDEQDRTELKYDVIFRLNESGEPIEVKKYLHGRVFDRKYLTLYNSQGKGMKMVGHLKAGYQDPDIPGNDSAYKKRREMLSKQVSEIYEYDKNGYISQCILDPANFSGEKYIYKYNSKGDMIERDYYLNPKVIMEVNKFVYDNRHLVVEEKTFHNDRLMNQVNYSYLTFDSENNWTKRKVSYDGRTIILTRKITYY